MVIICLSYIHFKKTKSLIVTDLIQNHCDKLPSGLAGVVTKYIFEPIGFKAICLAPPLKLGFMIKNKPEFSLFKNHCDKLPSGLAGVVTKYIFEPIGFKGICLAPPLKLGFMIKNKPGFSLFINRILDWDFDRIIVTHGDIIESDAKTVFARLCERFLK